MSLSNWSHSFFIFFFFIEFTFFFGSSILILLIFGYKIVHVGFSFSEFHFVHTFTSIPMEESLSSEHSSKLFGDSLEHFLDSSGVTNESNRHLKTFWRNITDCGFNVVWNPFNEIWRVFVLDVKHLFINLFGGHSSSEHSGGSKISSVSWVRSTHHVFSIEHLLGEFWYGESSINLRSSWGKWSKTNHEEMKSRERYKVYTEFS